MKSIEFIDFSNEDNFKITDISKTEGPKTIVDASDSAIIDRINGMPSDQKISFLDRIQNSLTNEEINILLGRKQGIEEFERQLGSKNWSEAQWQIFFEKEQWVFGYGLDYRITRPFDREVTVGIGGTDNKDKPIIDFLMTFTDYTVLVEIKKPDTPIFKRKRGGRAGTWEFSSEFMSAVSQIIEQKAEWLHYAQTTQHYKKSGTEILTARTKNAKSILVIGTRDEFSDDQDLRSANIRRDTFELFRRENRSIDIITFDEMLERAQFITRDR